MKKLGKITAVLLVLLTVISIFAACGKDDNKEEETTTEGFTLQANNGEAEITEESTTQAEATTEATTKAENTTKVKPTVKIPDIVTKAPSTTKVPSTTNAPSTTQHEETDTTVPPTTEPGETLDPNVEKLIGRYEATFMSEGVDFYLQFVFKNDKSVTVELTKDNYNKMIDGIVEKDAFDVTLEELEAVGVDNVTDYKIVLREYLVEELPYDDLKEMFKTSGTWEFEGDKLYVTIDGETAVCEDDGFMEYGTFFGLKFADGSSMSLSKKP